jgi:site-specific DNA recombinase
MRVVGYTRVSTEEQAREGYGLSAQEQAIRAYCLPRQWTLADIYTDAGVSGKSMKGRDELARLLNDARAGAFAAVIFGKLDRLARNLRDLLDIWDALDRAGVGVICIDQNIDTTTSAGRLMRNIFGSVGEFERDVIRDRIKAGLGEKARQGHIVGPLPLGYVRGEDGAVTVEPVIAPLINEAFVRYASGSESMRDMAAWAEGVGLRSSEGNPLDRLSIRKLLSTVTYTGMVTYHGDVIANGKHPAIVDAALFAKVQETIRSRTRYFPPTHPFGREPYPLSGVAICGHCSTSLVGLTRSQQSDRYRYEWYRCSTAHRRGKDACEQPMVRTQGLEEQVAAYVGGMRLPPEYLGEVVAELRRRRERPSDPNEAAPLRQQLTRWRRLFALGEIDEVQLKAETKPLKARLAELDRPHEVLDVEAAVNLLRRMGTLWTESPRNLQREFVREVFERIIVTGPEISTITPHPAYVPLFVLDRRERFGQDGPEYPVVVNWLPGQGSNL